MLYRFYNFDYENTMDILLYHEKKITRDEFEKIVLKCKTEVEKVSKIINTSSDEELEQYSTDYLMTYSDKYNVENVVIKNLIKNYGFLYPKEEFTFTFNNGTYWSSTEEVNKAK